MCACYTAASEDHSDCDCFVCIILSHGEEGLVYATNGKVKIESLLRSFKSHEAASLVGKPKLFFIQVGSYMTSQATVKSP